MASQLDVPDRMVHGYQRSLNRECQRPCDDCGDSEAWAEPRTLRVRYCIDVGHADSSFFDRSRNNARGNGRVMPRRLQRVNPGTLGGLVHVADIGEKLLFRGYGDAKGVRGALYSQD